MKQLFGRHVHFKNECDHLIRRDKVVLQWRHCRSKQAILKAKLDWCVVNNLRRNKFALIKCFVFLFFLLKVNKKLQIKRIVVHKMTKKTQLAVVVFSINLCFCHSCIL